MTKILQAIVCHGCVTDMMTNCTTKRSFIFNTNDSTHDRAMGMMTKRLRRNNGMVEVTKAMEQKFHVKQKGA
jgi:hypothetical protein